MTVKKIFCLLIIISFILCYRCPTGVGKWASTLIQIPVIDVNHLENNFHLDFMITSLAVVLLPVQAREKFLENVRRNFYFEFFEFCKLKKLFRFIEMKKMQTNLSG